MIWGALAPGTSIATAPSYDLFSRGTCASNGGTAMRTQEQCAQATAYYLSNYTSVVNLTSSSGGLLYDYRLNHTDATAASSYPKIASLTTTRPSCYLSGFSPYFYWNSGPTTTTTDYDDYVCKYNYNCICALPSTWTPSQMTTA